VLSVSSSSSKQNMKLPLPALLFLLLPVWLACCDEFPVDDVFFLENFYDLQRCTLQYKDTRVIKVFYDGNIMCTKQFPHHTHTHSILLLLAWHFLVVYDAAFIALKQYI